MNDNNRIRVGVRTKFSSDGAIWEVIETTNVPDGEIVAVNGDHVRRMTLSQLLHDSRHRFIPTDATSAEEDHRETAALILGQLSPERLREVRDRAEHVREVLTGYRSGSAELPRPDEPRPQYDPALPLSARYEAKAAELQTSDRTVKRWVADFRRFGEAGLSDCRYTREPGIDPRWEAEALAVMADYTDLSRPTRSAVIRRTNRNCDERHGVGVVPIPSRAMAYRILAALEPRHPLFRLSTKRNRDADQRPDRPYGKLPCTHPGEYVYLDTTPLDVFAMDPLTLRWVAVELTVVMDRYTRCIIALMLTAVSTKAVDIASLLYQCQRPRPAGAHWPPHAVWPEHGMPRCIFIDPTAIEGPRKGVAGPAVVPETIIVDHGKVFVSEHVTSACARLGISIQPARIREGRDKGPVERFFKTIRQDLLQHLDGYKGPDVHSRGLDVEKRAFYYIDELEEIIREWVAAVYHHRPHGGLIEPGLPSAEFTPATMYHHGLARAGFIEASRDPDLAYEFLEAVPRTIQHYGIQHKNRIYQGQILNELYGQTSPYTGKFKGKWPLYVDANDVRYAFFRHPKDHTWHRLTWDHADGLTMPMAEEALEFGRKLASRRHRFVDHRLALEELLTRWEVGSASSAAERRIAINMAREDRLHLSAEGTKASAAQAVADLPSVTKPPRRSHDSDLLNEVRKDEAGDDDTEEELDDDFGGDDDDFYSGSFEDA